MKATLPFFHCKKIERSPLIDGQGGFVENGTTDCSGVYMYIMSDPQRHRESEIRKL